VFLKIACYCLLKRAVRLCPPRPLLSLLGGGGGIEGNFLHAGGFLTGSVVAAAGSYSGRGAGGGEGKNNVAGTTRPDKPGETIHGF